MAAEARAMLDALMGQDRNTGIVPATSDGNQTNWDSLRKKKSCYDKEVCPLYCAWGTDVFELFTNTKSDLGPNPYQVGDDAREEYLSLPEHEKDRLGFERMLHRKLGELVSSCDRIVTRNKEKLRQEIAKAARARGTNVTRIDPVTDVSDDMIRDAAEIMADLELREEEVKDMLNDLIKIDFKWKVLWVELQDLKKDVAILTAAAADADADAAGDAQNSANEGSEVDATGSQNLTTDAAPDVPDATTDANGEKKEPEAEPTGTNESARNEKEAKIKEIKSKLYTLSAEQQKIIAAIASLTSSAIVPLRDNLQNLTKQLYYVKTDMSADKTVCEVSGNFMSFRDAEERIAAHYAGKQFVGWKLVREKFQELELKARNWRPMGGGGGGPPPGPPSRGGGYGPPSGGGSHGRGRPNDRDRGQGHGGYGRRGDDRSRSRDHDEQRWERDRGGGGGYNRGGGGDRRGWR